VFTEVNLPTHERVYGAAGIVRWVRGEEYGVETLVIDNESRDDVEEYLWQQGYESAESTPMNYLRPNRETMPLDEATGSSLREIAATVDVLER